MRTSRSLVLPLACALAGCGSATASVTTAEERPAADLAGNGGDAVVLLSWAFESADTSGQNPQRLCTGVLIAPNLVLTALICVAEASTGPIPPQCRSNGALVPGATGGWFSAPIAASEVHVYLGGAPLANVAYQRGKPVYRPDAYGSQILGSGSTEMCIDNIALVVLDRALSPAPLPLRLERPMRLGEPLVAVGHEVRAGLGPGIVNPPDIERTVTDDLHVVAVGPDREREESGLPIPRTFLTEDVGYTLHQAGTPALSVDTGAVVGLYVGNPSRAVVKTAPYASLIDDAFAIAGADPISEFDPLQRGAPTREPNCTLARGAAHGSGMVVALGGLGWLSILLRRRSGASC